MARLELDFVSEKSSRGEDISLAASRFVAHPGASCLVSLRTTSVVPAHATFQWTAGVKSMCLFFLSAAAHLPAEGHDHEAALAGEAGSAAASLDYTMSKAPAWLVDMFGSRADGTLVFNSLVRRVNPNRKRPGPVKLFVGPGFVPSRDLICRLDGEPFDSSRLRLAVENLESQLRSEKRRGRGSMKLVEPKRETPRPLAVIEKAAPHFPSLRHVIEERSRVRDQNGFLFPRLQELLRAWIRDEMALELSASENFSERGRDAALCRFEASLLFRKLSGEGFRRVGTIRSLSYLESLGFSSERAVDQAPVEVRLTTESIGAVSLFTYLGCVEGMPFRIRFPHASTHGLADAMEIGDRELAGDICSLNPATAGLYLGKTTRRSSRVKGSRAAEYVPLLFSPKGRLSSVALAGGAKRAPVYAAAHKDSASILGMYLAEIPEARMSKAAVARSGALALREAPDPEECLVSWFPYTQLLSELYDMRPIERGRVTSGVVSHAGSDWPVDNIFFCHRALAEDTARLHDLLVALRRAWLALRESARLRELVSALLVTDDRYMTLVRRRAGFHELPEMLLEKLV